MHSVLRWTLRDAAHASRRRHHPSPCATSVGGEAVERRERTPVPPIKACQPATDGFASKGVVHGPHRRSGWPDSPAIGWLGEVLHQLPPAVHCSTDRRYRRAGGRPVRLVRHYLRPCNHIPSGTEWRCLHGRQSRLERFIPHDIHQFTVNPAQCTIESKPRRPAEDRDPALLRVPSSGAFGAR